MLGVGLKEILLVKISENSCLVCEKKKKKVGTSF